MTTAVTTSTFAGLIVRFRSVIGRMPIMIFFNHKLKASTLQNTSREVHTSTLS